MLGRPGGHIELGETPLQALVREAHEELAVLIDPGDAVLVDVVHGDDFELAVYSTHRWTGDAVNAAVEEHDEIAWLSIEEIAERTLAHPAISNLATAALAQDGSED